MELKRYIVVPVIITQDKTLIPLWDERVKCEKGEYDWQAKIEGGNWRGETVVEAIFDLKTKTLSLGTEIDYYPETKEFKEGDTVLYEITYKEWGLSKIHQIVFEEYDLDIRRGKKLDHWAKRVVEEKGNIEKDMIYCVKQWKPYYLLENGEVIQWDHQLKKFKEQ